MTSRGTKFNLCRKNPTNLIRWNGTIAMDWLYKCWAIQSNGCSYFDWINLFNTSSSWLSTSNQFEGIGLLGFLDASIFDWRLTLTWLTRHWGWWGQFILVCPKLPPYRHRRFARCLCFLYSVKGPQWRVVSISIGVRSPIRLGVGVYIVQEDGNCYHHIALTII